MSTVWLEERLAGHGNNDNKYDFTIIARVMEQLSLQVVDKLADELHVWFRAT